MGQKKAETPQQTTADIDGSLRRWLTNRADAGQMRQRHILSSPQGPVVVIDDKPLINFCSNDYLGLANHPAIIAALKRGADRYGFGSGASQLICGHSQAHAELEEQLAEFTGRDRALIFSNGYMANLAVISAFAGRGDVVLGDRLNHASLIDGARLSGAKFRRYPHADCKALKRLLSATSARNKLVITDGVFSMDGDMAPLPGLVEACRQHEARLLVDDAHGFGVLGKTGAGVLEHYDLSGADVPLLMATFGKALGCFGAFVAGDAIAVEYLIQAARPYIYTTALPPSLAVAALEALRQIREEPAMSERLHSLIGYYRRAAADLELPVMDSKTPIQPLLLGTVERATAISNALRMAGFYVTAIRPPTVPVGTSRLRVTLTAAHTHEQIDRFLNTLSRLMRQVV